MKKLFLLLTTALGLAGCASSVYEGRYAWDDGWRQGTVAAVGIGPKFSERVAKNCAADQNGSSTSQRYLTVRILTFQILTGRGSRMENGEWRTVPISADARWKIDDPLYVNVSNCKIALQPRAM